MYRSIIFALLVLSGLTACQSGTIAPTASGKLLSREARVAPGYTKTVFGPKLLHSFGLAIDPKGDIYVTQASRGAITKIAPDGTYTTIWSGLNGPAAIAVDATASNIFTLVSTPGDPHGRHCPAQRNCAALMWLSADGHERNLRTADVFETGGVAIDRQGEVYFSSVVAPIGVFKIRPDVLCTINLDTRGRCVPDPFGSGLKRPDGVTVDAAGDVWVADRGHHSVRKFAPNGKVLATYYTGLKDPIEVAVDGAGFLYVADEGDSEIKIYAPNGAFATIASIRDATAIAVNPHCMERCTVYVSEVLGDIWKLSP